MKSKRKAAVIIAAVMVTAMILASCGGGVQKIGGTSKPEGFGLSQFEMQTTDGDVKTEAIYKDAKLTMVNVWATYCSPCISEMPELQAINEEYKDKGFQVVGLASDISKPDDASAHEIFEETGVTYINLVPNSDVYNGFLREITSVPTTFFVDENGNQIGEPYIGSRSKADWQEIIDYLLGEV